MWMEAKQPFLSFVQKKYHTVPIRWKHDMFLFNKTEEIHAWRPEELAVQ